MSLSVTENPGQCLISPFLAYNVVRRSGGFNLELKLVSFHWPFLNSRSVWEVSEGGRRRGFYLQVVNSGGVSDRKLGAGHPDGKPTLPTWAAALVPGLFRNCPHAQAAVVTGQAGEGQSRARGHEQAG